MKNYRHWTLDEERTMVELVKKYEAARANHRGIMYLPTRPSKLNTVVNELNKIYQENRTEHSIRTKFQKMAITREEFYPNGQLRITSVEPAPHTPTKEISESKHQLLQAAYGNVDMETFIKLQSQL